MGTINRRDTPLTSSPITALTVRELHTVLTQLLPRHGDTRIAYAEWYDGFKSFTAITLWDTTNDMEQGLTDAPLTIVLHSGFYPPEKCESGPELIFSGLT